MYILFKFFIGGEFCNMIAIKCSITYCLLSQKMHILFETFSKFLVGQFCDTIYIQTWYKLLTS